MRARRAARRSIARGAVSLALAALVAGSPSPAGAATITVDHPSIGDGGDELCDLVEAIENANADAAVNPDCEPGEGGQIVDVVELAVDVTLDQVYEETSATFGPIGLPVIVTAMVIRGDGSVSEGGAAQRAIRRDAGAADDFRLLFVGAGGDLTLDGVLLSGGLLSDLEDSVALGSWGGAIFNEESLSLVNSTVSGNRVSADAQSSPGVLPFAYGGGIFNLGDLTVTDSTIADNVAHAADAVPPAAALAAGGGIASGCFFFLDEAPTLTLSHSTVSGNTSDAVAAGRAISYGGGIYAFYRTVEIVNAAISGNLARGQSGAVTDAGGGGIEVYDADVVLSHATVAANRKQESGAGVDQYGAGVELSGFGSLTLDGSLVAHSQGDNCGPGITDGGGNLADDDTCGTIPGTLEGLDPVLADNGGPTRTHRTTSTSNARDLGGICGLDDDQRGVSRSIDGLCDSGSYEFFCGAPDEDVALTDDLLLIERTVEACGTITGGPDYEVGDGGSLIARAGSSVVLENGFEVTAGGRMSVTLDPSIQMPATAASAEAASAVPGSGSPP